MDLDLLKIKKIFFIGVGGIGISALAKMAISRGIEVSGVNDDESPKTLNCLRDAGATIFFQKDFDQLPEADMYVYSDAWIYRGPDIIENAKKTGKPVMNYFEALGQFAKEYKVIAIAGTHGKTTTTAMLADVLVEAGLDPTVIVGSFVTKFDSNFRKGNSDPRHGGASYLVVEADEYNRHFLSLNPFITVITNVEADHLDCYKDLADIQEAFKKLLTQTEGSVIYNSKDPNAMVLIQKFSGKLVDYVNYLGKVPRLAVPGLHNRMNASAALAVADILGINSEDAEGTIAEFSGTWRRLEKKGETAEGTVIYDDYAHHPTEIKASLQALRELYPKGEKKITVLFQPHLYSRTKALFDDFVKSFNKADQVLLLPIYFAREDKDESISSEKLAEAIALTGDNPTAQAFSSFELAENFVKGLKLGANDIFVTMGAGEAYKVADKVFNVRILL
jgi:UDP-N-acetylmuramate--alanine ligase